MPGLNGIDLSTLIIDTWEDVGMKLRLESRSCTVPCQLDTLYWDLARLTSSGNRHEADNIALPLAPQRQTDIDTRQC